MKTSSFFAILCIMGLLIPGISFAEGPKTKQPSFKPLAQTNQTSPSALNIAELTNAQMFRYGREMFLRGNYAEAVRIFAEILRLDCHNKTAHYHLQKIADTVPAYAYLKDQLKDFPCGTYDFSKEDFLPASVYYEKDPDLILEQLAAYHKRQRLNETEMNANIERFNTMVRELELTIATIMQDHAASGKTIAAISEEDQQRMTAGEKIANKIQKEIDLVKTKLAAERLERQKEVQDLRVRLAAAEARLANEAVAPKKNTAPPDRTSPPEPQASVSKQSFVNAVSKAKAELQVKETEVSDQDSQLLTLQARFDDLQRRLKIIQDELAGKNSQLQTIQHNLQDIQKP